MRAIILNRVRRLALAAVGVGTVLGGVWTLQATAARPQSSASEILGRRPLFGQAWLNLAAAEFRATGALSDAGRAALARSQEVSPNEGQLLIERMLLGLPAWAYLTAELKDGVARDLAGALTVLRNDYQLRLMLSVMSEADRGELKAMLVGRRVAEARLVGVGF